MYAEYSGRTLYVALSTDSVEGAKNGDKLYEMDTGKRYVYNETNDAWDEQPDPEET
nr:MAG: FG-GAP repeat protein [Bacteriophage sp.]